MRVEPDDIVVGAIDVGAPHNIGWAILSDGSVASGDDLDEFIDRFGEIAQGRPAALGFEAPLYIPVRDELGRTTKARRGEGSRPWSAHAGAAVTTIGIAVMAYTFAKLKTHLGHRAVTLDWRNWPKGDAVLVWEAFVSGSNHAGPGEHWVDAMNAAKGFKDALANLDAANAVVEENVFSVAGACLAHSGLVTPSAALLREPCLVIRSEGTVPAGGDPSESSPIGTAPTKSLRSAWASNPENLAFDAFIAPHYRRQDGTPDIDRLYEIVALNDLGELRERYGHLNPGQQVMALRRLLRPLWRSGYIKLP